MIPPLMGGQQMSNMWDPMMGTMAEASGAMPDMMLPGTLMPGMPPNMMPPGAMPPNAPPYGGVPGGMVPPGMMQGGSNLPVPGGLDGWPSYASPHSGMPTAPFLPYTPPTMENVDWTSFDEIDLAAYQGLLERLAPDRLTPKRSSAGGPGTPTPGGGPAPTPAPAPAPAPVNKMSSEDRRRQKEIDELLRKHRENNQWWMDRGNH